MKSQGNKIKKKQIDNKIRKNLILKIIWTVRATHTATSINLFNLINKWYESKNVIIVLIILMIFNFKTIIKVNFKFCMLFFSYNLIEYELHTSKG